MAADYKRQVLALRPNAKLIETKWAGLFICDGEELLAGEDGPTHKEGQAWYRAFQYLMVRFRSGVLRP